MCYRLIVGGAIEITVVFLCVLYELMTLVLKVPFLCLPVILVGLYVECSFCWPCCYRKIINNN